jgi:hypothetical protein
MGLLVLISVPAIDPTWYGAHINFTRWAAEVPAARYGTATDWKPTATHTHSEKKIAGPSDAPDYYASVNMSATGGKLKKQLKKLIQSHKVLQYHEVWGALEAIELDQVSDSAWKSICFSIPCSFRSGLAVASRESQKRHIMMHGMQVRAKFLSSLVTGMVGFSCIQYSGPVPCSKFDCVPECKLLRQIARRT